MSDTPCAAWKESRWEQAPAGPRLSVLCVILDEQGSSEGEGLGGDQQGEGVGAYVMQLKKRAEKKVHNM